MSPKILGQHFLNDVSVANRIVDSSHFEDCHTIVEIGPGRGALTDLIVKSFSNVFLIELDSGLSSYLTVKHGNSPNVSIFNADARNIDIETVLGRNSSEYLLTGNLPYYAAKRIIRNFLEHKCTPKQMVVMIQKEVAEEMAAKSGNQTLLSLSVQVYAEIDILFTVDPSSFLPPPKVYSSVIRLNPRLHTGVKRSALKIFFLTAKAAFYLPRKQLHNSLALGIKIHPSEAKNIISKADIDSSRRPGTLTISEINRLAGVLSKDGFYGSK